MGNWVAFVDTNSPPVRWLVLAGYDVGSATLLFEHGAEIHKVNAVTLLLIDHADYRRDKVLLLSLGNESPKIINVTPSLGTPVLEGLDQQKFFISIHKEAISIRVKILKHDGTVLNVTKKTSVNDLLGHVTDSANIKEIAPTPFFNTHSEFVN